MVIVPNLISEGIRIRFGVGWKAGSAPALQFSQFSFGGFSWFCFLFLLGLKMVCNMLIGFDPLI